MVAVQASYAPFNPLPMFRKTQLCKFFAKGRCQKGSDCVYAHGRKDLAVAPDFSRTSLCPYALRNMWCPNGACKFAHSEAELKPRLAIRDLNLDDEKPTPSGYWSRQTTAESLFGVQAPPGYASELDEDDEDDEMLDTEEPVASDATQNAASASCSGSPGPFPAASHAGRAELPSLPALVVNNTFIDGIEDSAAPELHRVCSSPALLTNQADQAIADIKIEEDVDFESEMSTCAWSFARTTAESDTWFQEQEDDKLLEFDESEEDGHSCSAPWAAGPAQQLPATPGLIVRHTFIDGTEDSNVPVTRRVHSMPDLPFV